MVLHGFGVYRLKLLRTTISSRVAYERGVLLFRAVLIIVVYAFMLLQIVTETSFWFHCAPGLLFPFNKPLMDERRGFARRV